MTELMMVSLIMSLVAGGIWGVYFTVANIYVEEQQVANIQNEGDWILDLIENGGHHSGKRIYGLKSMLPVTGYPNMGAVAPVNFSDSNDYRIEFPLDDGTPDKQRWVEFYIDFDATGIPTSKLGFRLIDPRTTGNNNYDVTISEKILARNNTQDANDYTYNRTTFKVEPISPNTFGIRISFYLFDNTKPILYNYRLDRKLINPIDDDAQRRRYLDGIPYPQYFSRTIYFPNAN